MPARIFYDQDADLGLLRGKTVAVIGYGSQGHAHSLNMRDSGVNVTIATYAGSPSAARAKEEGLPVATIEDAVKNSDVIMILLPDETQKKVYKASIEPHLRRAIRMDAAAFFQRKSGRRHQLWLDWGRDRT